MIKHYLIRLLIVLVVVGLLPLQAFAQKPAPQPPAQGAFFTGEYRNMLAEWGLSSDEIQARIDQTWQQLFYGDDNSQRVYYPVGDDMAYVMDIANNDIRSEGMSYGMMIAVQMDKKAEFDRLWKWAMTYMYNADEPYKGYFAWHCSADGKKLDHAAAPDGETWFTTALFFAAARWGNGEGIFDYTAQANAILDAMLHEGERSKSATNMFDAQTKQVVFVPSGSLARFTDPSYHLPEYYELWARWAAKDNQFWTEAAAASRAFWKTTANPNTGLMPDYAEFTGEPKARSSYGEYFYADAWRTAMNVAVDYAWFAADPWEIEQTNRQLEFFYGLGIGQYNSKFTIDGQPVDPQHRSTALIAMNAAATLAATTNHAWDFIEEFWNSPIPSGQYRYFDGMLYLMALLHLSGNFRIYDPTLH